MRRGGRGRNGGKGAQARLLSGVSSGVAKEARHYGIDEEQAKRLCTWAVEIARVLLPAGTHSYAAGTEVRFGRKGSLVIHEDGSWHDFSGDMHGFGALSLVGRLLDDGSPPTVQRFAAEWLQQHPGNGSHATVGGSNDASVSAREKWFAAHGGAILRDSTSIAIDSDVGINLRARGLPIPSSDVARRYPKARTGEAGLIGILRRPDGRVVGVQVGYIDPQGRKSALEPKRNIFMVETNKELRAAARFRIPAEKMPETTEGLSAEEVFARDYADMLFFVEGLEDALSIHQAMPYSECVGLPGIARLNRQPAQAKQKVIVVRDGDATDSDAATSLQRGLDHLLICHATVLVTDTPAGEDANSVLQKGGIAAVQALIGTAKPPSLSEDGEFRRLAAMPKAEYERERHIVAKRLGMKRVTVLDDLVNAKRPLVAEGEEPDELADIPWETPVTDLAAVLEEGLAVLRRFLAASEVHLAAAVVWSAHTHIAWSEIQLLTVTPRALITAVAENSGKSTLLKGMLHLSARGILFVNMSAAALFRVVDDLHCTLFVDEADTAFAHGGNRELLSLINAGHERGAVVPRVEEIDGERHVVRFTIWGPVAMAAIGRLPAATTQSRCVVFPLRRAAAGEVAERLRPGMEDVFVPIRRKLVRWAQDLTALPAVPMVPGLDNRTGDNWEPLRQIALLAGGRWPELIDRAAMIDAIDSADVGSLVPLLTDIRRVFGTRAGLSTKELIEGLLALEEPSAEWDRANRGREITYVWLGKRLRGALPIDEELQRRRRTNARRGYAAALFDDAYARYLPATLDSNSPEGTETAEGAEESTMSLSPPPGGSDPSPVTFSNFPQSSAEKSVTGRKPQPVTHPSLAIPETPKTVTGDGWVTGANFDPSPENPSAGQQKLEKVTGDGSDPPAPGGTYTESPEATATKQPRVEELSKGLGGVGGSPPGDGASDGAAASPSRRELW